MMGNSLTTTIFMVLLVYILLVFLILSNYFSPSSVTASTVDKNNSNEKSSSSNQNGALKRRVQAKSGLYVNSKFVTEVANEQHLKDLVAEKKPLMVVFYASWCGHCR